MGILEAKYLQGIKAGIIGSVIIGICIFLILIINMITATNTAFAMLDMLGCCILIVVVLSMVGVGALGVRMASTDIVRLNDALGVSAVAGAIAGLVAGLVYAIRLILKPLLVYDPSYDVYGTFGYSPSSISAFGGILGTCCCLPATLVIAVVLAGIGGAIYAMAILKIK